MLGQVIAIELVIRKTNQETRGYVKGVQSKN